ncbi:MAG: hypothetical protein QCH96_06120 [Candidatus Thermoplasmatota archaeon]|nr:hypothetical protein [Candidatus Thermoplasmatota archaeon]
MKTEQKCIQCNHQDIVSMNHVRNINGELVRLCPICYTNISL